MDILLTGGNGLFGKELRKHLKVDAPSHAKFDIVSDTIPKESYDLVIHAAAYTDVVKAEKDRLKCFAVNVIGTFRLAKQVPHTPFVYISSEYAHNPVNYYGETKLAGETAVKAVCDTYLIIRTLFKPRPFPFKKAFINQLTQGDYVDVITKLIVKEIKKWDKKTSKTVYVGTGRKTIFSLALQTNKRVEPASVFDVEGVVLPHDYL